MAKFDITKFRTAPATEPTPGFWGGGHKVGDNIFTQGWKCKKSAHGIWILGQRKTKVCASIKIMGNQAIDVAIYDQETPKEVDLYIKGKSLDVLGPFFKEFKIYPGVGLSIIALLNQTRLEMENES